MIGKLLKLLTIWVLPANWAVVIIKFPRYLTNESEYVKNRENGSY